MHLPGFTAETAFHTSGERYAASLGDFRFQKAAVEPARRIGLVPRGDLRYFCGRNGIYWSPGETTSTYGCYRRDGSGGIVCGGDAPGCDTF